MKEDYVLKFPAVGTHFNSSNLICRWNNMSTKGKVMASAPQIRRGPGRSFSCHCCWKPCWGQFHSLQEYWLAGCAEVCYCHWTHSNCWLLLTWNLIDPMIVPKHFKCSLSICYCSFKPIFSSALCRLPFLVTAREITLWVLYGGCWPEKFCACISTSLVNIHGRSYLISTFTEVEKEQQATAEKAVNKKEIQGEWIALASEFTATEPEVCRLPEGMQVPPVPLQKFPTENWGTSWPPKAGLSSLWSGHWVVQSNYQVVLNCSSVNT